MKSAKILAVAMSAFAFCLGIGVMLVSAYGYSWGSVGAGDVMLIASLAGLCVAAMSASITAGIMGGA